MENESSIGYLLLALSELHIDCKKIKENVNEAVVSYINILSTSNSAKYTVQDVIMIYGLLKSGVLEVNNNILRLVENMDVDNAGTQALTAYYKYKIMFEYAGSSAKSLKKYKEFMKTYRVNGGFKMNKEDHFFDLQATYYFLDLAKYVS